MSGNHSRQAGFGVLELVVVLAIVGVLAAVALPMYRDYVVRARVTEALAVADSERTAVEIALVEGPPQATNLLGKGPQKAGILTALDWTPAAPAAGASVGKTPLGAIVPRMTIPGLGEKSILALQRMSDGTWVCVNAAKVGKADALEETYLPPICHGAGSSLAAVAVPTTPATCPAGQESVTLSVGGKDTPACTAKCPAGQTRDSGNPSQCKDVVCGPNEIKHYDTKLCVTIPPKPTCPPGEDAFRGYDTNNYPNWGCRSACPPGQMPGMAWKCIPDPNAKVSTPAATAAPAAKPAVPVAAPPAAQAATVKCRSCTPGMEDICELVHEEITCTAPNNWCITFIDNQEDGSKIVKRGCGDYKRVFTEWYQGTSDDDKCRERLNTQQTLAFTCTFGCNADNCNDNLRPAEDTLFQPK